MRNKTKNETIKVDGGFEIKSGIPMPEETGRKGVKSPFRKTVEAMAIGQCFDTDQIPKHRYSLEKKLNIKLMVQKMDNGFRVWRSK